MARSLAEAWGGLDPEYVEAAAWLHDIGRARTHGVRHPIEGFRLVVEAGHPGYAPPCLSHYCKGQPPEGLGVEPALVEEMRAACDLDTFDTDEQLIALADFLAAGTERVPLEERHRDLVRRYGASAFFDRNLAICRVLKRDFESRTGRPLYPTVGL